MILDQLRGMVAEQLGVSEDEVKPESRLKEDLGADSASVMMLVMDVESEFGIEVEDDAIAFCEFDEFVFEEDADVVEDFVARGIDGF